MGIVVSVAMLLALVMMIFDKWLRNKKDRFFIHLGIGFIALSGLWNSFWYGVQNVPSFWGFAALLSGLFMLAAVSTFYLEMRMQAMLSSCSYAAFRLAVMVGLGLYFLLYLVTIVQINLNMPIVH